MALVPSPIMIPHFHHPVKPSVKKKKKAVPASSTRHTTAASSSMYQSVHPFSAVGRPIDDWQLFPTSITNKTAAPMPLPTSLSMSSMPSMGTFGGYGDMTNALNGMNGMNMSIGKGKGMPRMEHGSFKRVSSSSKGGRRLSYNTIVPSAPATATATSDVGGSCRDDDAAAAAVADVVKPFVLTLPSSSSCGVSPLWLDGDDNMTTSTEYHHTVNRHLALSTPSISVVPVPTPSPVVAKSLLYGKMTDQMSVTESPPLPTARRKKGISRHFRCLCDRLMVTCVICLAPEASERIRDELADLRKQVSVIDHNCWIIN
jgi:hypothetical protein